MNKSFEFDQQHGSLTEQLALAKESGALKTGGHTDDVSAAMATADKKEAQVRGGRSSKASKSLGPAVKKTQEEKAFEKNLLENAREKLEKDEKRFKKEAEEMLRARAVFTENINLLKKRLPETTGKETERLQSLLSQAEDHVRIIDEISPHETPSTERDSHLFQNIVEKFKKYEEARRRQTHAEIKFNKKEGGVMHEVSQAQSEAHALKEEISALIKEGGVVVAKNESIPARDEGIHYTHEQSLHDKNAWELAHRATPEIFNYESANDGTQEDQGELGIKKEEAPMSSPVQPERKPVLLNETESGEKIMEPKFAMEGSMDEKGSLPAGAHEFKDEMIARLAERAEKTDPASLSEKTDIAQAISAFDQNVAKLIGPKTETASQDTGKATSDNWQDEAIRNFESKGGKVLDDSLLVLTEIVEETISTTQKEQSATEKPEPTPETSKLELTPEQAALVKKFENNIALVEGEVETRAEKAGVLDFVRKAGETWNKFPTRYKILFSVGVAVSGAGAALAGATAVAGTMATIGVGLRIIGGTAMFAAFEKLLRNSSEKDGAVRTKSQEVLHTAGAAFLAIFIAGVLPGIIRDYAVDHGMAGKVSGIFGGGTAHTEIPATTGNILDTGAYIETVKPGDSVWKMAERQLEAHYGEKFTELSPEKQTYIIDAIKDKVAAYPESYGIAGSDASALGVGENVDFGGLLANKTFMDEAFSGAQDLIHEEIKNIGNYSGETAGGHTETPARVVPAEEFIKERLLTDFNAPEQVIPTEDAPKDILMEGYTSTMPAEFTPSDPQILAYANQQVHDHVNDLFGSKGFLGFGAEDGMNSINWKDPDVGFANKTVEQVMNAEPSAFPEDGARHFGIEDYSATEKMKSYLNLAGKETGVVPHRGENVQAYINRAAAINIDRFVKNG